MGIKVKPSLKRLAFWQSESFYVLTRGDNGRVSEDEVGSSKPKGVEFVKGGRKRAYDEAERLWHKAETETEAEDKEAGKVEPDYTEPLEPQPKLKLSPSPVRITPRVPRISGGGSGG